MKKRIIIIISVLLALTAVFTIYHLCTRESVKSGEILVKSSSASTTINTAELQLVEVSGETVNKKGEVKKINAVGYPVSDIPALCNITDYSELTVYSDDEYHADISREELDDHEKAWLISDEGSMRLIVFGDTDSKRNVKNVVRIEIR